MIIRNLMLIFAFGCKNHHGVECVVNVTRWNTGLLFAVVCEKLVNCRKRDVRVAQMFNFTLMRVRIETSVEGSAGAILPPDKFLEC